MYAAELGEAVITAANSESGCMAKCTITVLESQPATGIKVNTPILYFEVGDEIMVADIYYSIYDKNTGVLKSVYYEKNIEIPSNDVYIYNSDVSISDEEKAKIYVWQTGTMIPLCASEAVE